MTKWKQEGISRWQKKEGHQINNRWLKGRERSRRFYFDETGKRKKNSNVFMDTALCLPESLERTQEEPQEERRDENIRGSGGGVQEAGRRLFIRKRRNIRIKQEKEERKTLRWIEETGKRNRKESIRASSKKKSGERFRKEEQIKTIRNRDFQRVRRKRKPEVQKAKEAIVQLGKHMLNTLYSYLMQGALLLLPVLILPLLVVGILYCSPFAVFAPPLSEDNDVRVVLKELDTCYQEELQDVLTDMTGYDKIEIYMEDFEGDALTSNYEDVLMVYMASYNVGRSVTLMEGENKILLETLFEEMNQYSIRSRTEQLVEFNEEGEEVVTLEMIKEVYVTRKTYWDYIGNGRLSEYQEEMLLALMEGTNEYVLLPGVPGINREEVLETADNDMVHTILDYALTQVGKPYSQEERDSGDAFDCSSLTYYAYRQAGISLQYQGSNTAAAQGQLCEERGWIVSEEELRPGDLIFYSFAVNGRYKNISHVAIYAGNGMVIDASSSKGYVVYREMYSWEKVVLCARPQ